MILVLMGTYIVGCGDLNAYGYIVGCGDFGTNGYLVG